ncbi:type I methionyl aminopeptidase [Leptospira langatensis]|uniref:Methionine aminopeptidase n=1 Tax=Leptospira langatensis TaxID=2484983 RepID=A0A5F1ZQF8_9LEPT|nr:type I methionyl aminopeptidase [Leptospira langatensis]TGK02765.1 type I methionyl aminopeptidase [Leptospira langatensis]TGL40030.1 type I methionyl aminopeptidase [Leptospira langatensis]
MTIRNKEDLEALQKIGRITADTLVQMREAAKPGISTKELDHIAHSYFSKFGARSAPQLMYQFPGYTCISLNTEIAHGIPSDRILKEGDLLNLDVSLELNGYFADTGFTLIVGKDHKGLSKLLDVSSEALKLALANVKTGQRLNSIGRTIENTAKKNGFKVIRTLCGHGVGKSLHEEPFDICNYYEPRDKRILRSGQVIAVETFVSTGAEGFVEGSDGWTLTTPDGSYTAQFEHSVVVTEFGPIILTAA